MRSCSALAVLVGLALASPATAEFPDASGPPPAGWTGRVFRLSQACPPAPPPAEEPPWAAVDFRTRPEDYLAAVLAYVLEGNLEADWVVQDNPLRPWYHAPWMHWGANGREFVRGLTRERTSPPGELHPDQSRCAQNWAVGVDNLTGGFVLGRVWEDREAPEAALARFPEGTVATKLLVTAAPVEQAPYLDGAPTWQADIHVIPEADTRCLSRGARAVQEVRLLQLDVAVRDGRADATTGWVFGTFVHDGDRPGATAWARPVAVGLMWGNDPERTPAAHAAGAQARESWPNPAVGPPQHLGWLGRLNGPVDNPRSACLSCHATAQVPAVSAMVPPFNLGDEAKMRWFRNVTAGEPFDPGAVSLDYSLQVAFGIQNLAEARAVEAELVAAGSAAALVSCAQRAAAIAGADVDTIIDRAPDGRAIYRVTRGE